MGTPRARTNINFSLLTLESLLIKGTRHITQVVTYFSAVAARSHRAADEPQLVLRHVRVSVDVVVHVLGQCSLA